MCQDLVLRLLRRRWRTVSPGLEARVPGLSLERQASLAEALLDLQTLSDLAP